jgi:hypothetical protein
MKKENNMINWKTFETKYDKREQWAFEQMSYFLFCVEMGCHTGIFRYKNQAGIETEPVEKDGLFYGFQAKYYSTALSTNKNDIIVSIQKAKQKNNSLNKILLYTNQELSESSRKDQKKPGYQIEIENAAQNNNIELEWRVPSILEYQLLQTENKWIFNIFFGSNGLDPEFFKNQVEKEIQNLGPRFNSKLNFELPIAKVFDSISRTEIFIQTIIEKIDEWLTEKSYRRLMDNAIVTEIEKELDILKNEVKDWVVNFQNTNSIQQEITLLPLTEKIEAFNSRISEKKDQLWNEQCREKKHNRKFDTELNRLREIESANDNFLYYIDELHIDLANQPTLIIQGEAGCGKSHLLGDIASRRSNQSLPTILLLGTTFNNSNTIEQNILNKLDLTCSFEEFLKNLNSIGLLINERVLILIDAINEGAGADLWKNQIAGFISEIKKYPAIGLVLTIRSTYFDDIIPTDFSSTKNITIITHKGFAGEEYEVLKLFSEFYGLKLPNIPILNPEYTNPLFLNLVCNAIKDRTDKSFPQSFSGLNSIYELYKNSLNKKFEEKRPEYKNRNIVSQAIDKFSQAIFNSKYGSLECSEAVALFDDEFPKFQYLLSDLIEESVLLKMKEQCTENPKDIILFSYQKLGDFYIAEKLLNSLATEQLATEQEIRDAFATNDSFKKIISEYQWQYAGIIDAFSILLPERYGLEITDFISYFSKEKDSFENNHIPYEFYQKLLDSLKWRNANSIDDEKVTELLIEYYCTSNINCFNEFLYALTELATIPNHPFNSDKLHKILLASPMPERDSYWQRFILWYSSSSGEYGASVHAIKKMIDWAWRPNISNNVDFETARLVAQTLAWVMASTKIELRDQTTKALVNLLEQQPKALITTLKAFEQIDDLYISERLYAIAYGCILRTEKDESIKIIAQYVYDTVFKNGNPPTHILLRDYARNTIEYAVYKNVELEIDVKLIRPPYKSKCNYIPLSNEELDVKYKPKDNKGHWGEEEWAKGAILRSMITEYGRGTGMYGDFGRYTFQSNLRDFDLPSKLNIGLLSNLAVEWIFEKYGYDTRLHGEYDHSTNYYNNYGRHANQVERIGKKYQWIALYEIMAIVADNFKMKNDWGNNSKNTLYKGTWHNFIRNIDPAYITKNNEKNKFDETKFDGNWYNDENYTHWNYPDAEWIETTEDLIDPKQIIEKTDANHEEWLRLYHDVSWDEPKKLGQDRWKGRRKRIWYRVQGYLIKKSDKNRIVKFLKTQNFDGRWMPECNDDSISLFNREKFWSPAYLDTYKDRDNSWQTIEDTKYKVLVANESAKGSFERDKSGTNQSYDIPCKFIFEGLELQYAPIDGDLKNKKGEIVVTNNNGNGLVIKKKELLEFLEEKNMDIIWTILGGKISSEHSNNGRIYYKVPCGVYYLKNGTLEGNLTMFDR